MEVTMPLIFRLFLIFLLLTFAACKEPNPSFVFLENATADRLQLIAEFDGADTASKPLIFQLDPGQRDGWRFIPNKKQAEHFDSSFRSLLIRSAKCERKIERSTLAKQVRKDGAWILRIDQTLFSC
jgi:hypothetical protein